MQKGSNKPLVYEFNAADLDCKDHFDMCKSICCSFIESAGKSLEGKRSGFCRGKPLLALSLPGVGNLYEDKTSEPESNLLKEVVPILYAAVNEYGVDIALCVADEDAYILSQLMRRAECPLEGGPFWMLSDKQQQDAARLENSAARGRLSIFIGAGISIPSGAPSWGQLLDDLAEKAGLSDVEKEQIQKLGYLDQPTIFAEEIGASWKQDVVDIIKSAGRYTPAHALLKSLRAPAVTTNYDTLYEAAAISCGDKIPQLPWDSREVAKLGTASTRSLLKLHGCADHPDSVILSREDYMRYTDKYQALRGRLQGMFLTTEMLFCGFSMTDDNVHKIIDDCRKVLYDEDHKPKDHMGTILTMIENPMFRRLWDQDFDIHSFGASWGDNPAWYHDCFLDCIAEGLVRKEAESGIILNPHFKRLLTKEQKDLKKVLKELAKIEEKLNLGGRTDEKIDEFLKDFGYSAGAGK